MAKELYLSDMQVTPLSMAFRDRRDERSEKGEPAARGAVYTRREVVEFILDLVGYIPDRPLYKLKLLEPSFGGGDFLIPAVERLLAAWRNSSTLKSRSDGLADCIRGVEIHKESFDSTRLLLIDVLGRAGIRKNEAASLLGKWLIQGDYLLSDLPHEFDAVVGNPPYVRQELLSDELMAKYRSLYSTIYDRSDLYVPFIERSLNALQPDGQLGFICSDRWMKNRYGAKLRQLISEKFNLKIYIDMFGTAAFHSDVSAYTAITIITRETTSETRVAYQPIIEKQSLKRLSNELLKSEHGAPDSGSSISVTDGSRPWLFKSGSSLRLLRQLETNFPSLEETGCKVGIGVATGADRSFIGNFDELDVESSRKLPLVMTRDIVNGKVQWRGKAVVNPFSDSGALVDLNQFPRLKNYLEQRKEAIAGRHVAKRAPSNWYRTIDRIYPQLASIPKLLIPDIGEHGTIVYEAGKYYPHHNLYYITSRNWDLESLQIVLSCGIARLFISHYSTQMRGGYLRFQAQYLRRIHIPYWDDVPALFRRTLAKAATTGDLESCKDVICSLFRISENDFDELNARKVSNAH